MALHELEILRGLLPRLSMNPSVTIAPGDDCAAVSPTPGMQILAAADQVILNVHYTGNTPPREAGAKLMNRNLSDIAAMGGTPRWAILTMALNGCDSAYAVDFAAGAAEAGKRVHVPVIGGDVAALPTRGEVSTLTILGEVAPGFAVTRSGAKAGDVLCVTGQLGGSFPSGRHLHFTPRLAEGKFLADKCFASAMLDVSDGFLLDASRLAGASEIALQIDLAAIPVHEDSTLEGALSDGEDYELLFTVPAEKFDLLQKTWESSFVPFHAVGRAVPGQGVIDMENHNLLINRRIGYEH